MERCDGDEIVNIGWGEDLSIRTLAETIADVVGYTGTIVFDPSKPDGTPRRLLDVSRLRALGWSPRIPLREGLEATYRWCRQSVEQARPRPRRRIAAARSASERSRRMDSAHSRSSR